MLQMTLGTLIKKLETTSPKKPVYFENVFTGGRGYTEIPEAKDDEIDPHRAGVGEFHSWRGDYSEFAISPSKDVQTVAEVITELKAAVNKKFYGYKGGEYLATEHHALYCAEYSQSKAWTRTDKKEDFYDDTCQTLAVALHLVDVIERKDEVVILYDEVGEY